MCCVFFNCFELILNFLHRCLAITFSCCIACSILLTMFCAIMTGIALGYNYSESEKLKCNNSTLNKTGTLGAALDYDTAYDESEHLARFGVDGDLNKIVNLGTAQLKSKETIMVAPTTTISDKAEDDIVRKVVSAILELKSSTDDTKFVILSSPQSSPSSRMTAGSQTMPTNEIKHSTTSLLQKYIELVTKSEKTHLTTSKDTQSTMFTINIDREEEIMLDSNIRKLTANLGPQPLLEKESQYNPDVSVPTEPVSPRLKTSETKSNKYIETSQFTKNNFARTSKSFKPKFTKSNAIQSIMRISTTSHEHTNNGDLLERNEKIGILKKLIKLALSMKQLESIDTNEDDADDANSQGDYEDEDDEEDIPTESNTEPDEDLWTQVEDNSLDSGE